MRARGEVGGCAGTGTRGCVTGKAALFLSTSRPPCADIVLMGPTVSAARTASLLIKHGGNLVPWPRAGFLLIPVSSPRARMNAVRAIARKV